MKLLRQYTREEFDKLWKKDRGYIACSAKISDSVKYLIKIGSHTSSPFAVWCNDNVISHSPTTLEAAKTAAYNHYCGEIAKGLVEVDVVSRFNETELRHILNKVKVATIKPNFKAILQRHFKEKYDSPEDVQFIAKYAGKTVNVYEWCDDWWICEDDNYPITEECFIKQPTK